MHGNVNAQSKNLVGSVDEDEIFYDIWDYD
jgi:hypothetical protein